jgi:uncharacterized GH25 family protein
MMNKLSGMRKPYCKASVSVFLFLVLLTPAIFAHDTWLIPDRFIIAKEATVTLDLTIGMVFPILETAIKPERIDQAKCRLSNHSFDVRTFAPAPKSLRFKARLYEPSIATFWVELQPKSLELTPRLVREYLDEIGASEAIRQQWANAKKPKRWREVYTKHAKTFVKVGDASSDRSWSEPVGMALEIVPDKDPTTFKAGDDFPVRLLKNGTLLPDFPIGIVREGSAKGQIQKTDTHGRVTFRLTKSGSWLLHSTELRQSNQANVEWKSNFTTLTIHVTEK